MSATATSYSESRHVCQSAVISNLYKSYYVWLVGWIHKKVGCPENAADLTHDTFLRLLSRKALPDLHEPRAFLSTIAKGLVIDHWRRKTIEEAYLEAVAHMAFDQYSSPEERQLTLETLFLIDAMLSGLSAGVRKAFLMSRLEGLTYKQIAAELNVSERTVKKYMAKAMLQCLQFKN